MQSQKQGKSGIDYFKSFLKDLGAIQGLLVGGTLLAPFFAEKLSGLAPPGFDSVKTILLLFQLVIVTIAFQVFKPLPRKACALVSVLALSCAFFLVVGYVYALESMTIKEPITSNRIIKGKACTMEAMQLIPKECISGDYTSDSLEKFAGQYDQLWSNYQSVALNVQIKLIFTWLAIFLLISLGVTIFVLTLGSSQ